MKIINILETSYCSYCKRDDILYLIEYVERYYNERPGAIILGINQQNMMTSNIIPAGTLRVYIVIVAIEILTIMHMVREGSFQLILHLALQTTEQ